MSGTSLDGVDAVILDASASPSVIACASVDITQALRMQLLTLMSPGASFAVGVDAIDALGLARRDLTTLYASAVNALPAAHRELCKVIGAHGQTIRHRPEQAFTLQILDGALLAELTGLPVVCDLRSADVAAGGQGAPLVPVFHGAAFGGCTGASDDEPIAVVNIGGIANVSIIGSGGRVLAGFDTGPGNRLMDDWIQKHRGLPFDPDGQWASGAQPDAALLNLLMQHPYYAKPNPKSTGREQFNLAYLDDAMAHGGRENLSAQCVQATLAELTACTIAGGIEAWPISQVLVCGGGAANADLMRRLAGRISAGANRSASCAATDTYGIPAQQVEAAAFAWLAVQRLNDCPVALSPATGARRDVIAGALHLPAP